MSSQSETNFVPTFIKTEQPIREGRKVALDETSFVKIFLESGLTQEAARKKYGVSHNMLVNSIYLYREKYAAEIKALKSRNYSLSKMGNTSGEKEQPDVIIPREVLEPLILAGKRYPQIAETLGTTEYYVRRNAEIYGIWQPQTEKYRGGVLPRRMQVVDLEYLEKLEQFAPGLLDAARGYYVNPHPFFLKVYEAQLKIHDLVWFLGDFAGAHRSAIEQGSVPRDHIAWSRNRFEMRLSMALLQHKIDHIREFMFHKTFRADFYFPGSRLLVELDGDYHDKCEVTKGRDLERQAAASEAGYSVLRFPNKRVERQMPEVVAEIKAALSHASSI